MPLIGGKVGRFLNKLLRILKFAKDEKLIKQGQGPDFGDRPRFPRR